MRWFLYITRYKLQQRSPVQHFFFLFTQFAGASPAVARGARGRIEESWANASDTCRDGGFLGATQHHRRDMQHHFGTQLKELIPSQHREGRV